jgi:Phytanoyl-CoA dioxygenase (PhyH)
VSAGTPVPLVDSALARAEELAASGRRLDALDLLRRVRPDRHDPPGELDRRLTALRYEAFGELSGGSVAQWPTPSDSMQAIPGTLAEVEPGDLTAGVVRRALLGCGGLVVRGLVADHVDRLVPGIDAALAAREGSSVGRDEGSWYHPLALERSQAQSLGRHWVAGSGGVLACDSPRFVNDLLELYEQIGLGEVITAYLGERPVLSANKCTLRHVPLTSGTDWHQDGAFLGSGIRALNVWVALTDCGVDAPGLDVVPLRLDQVLPTGTGGATFDWSVGPAVVESLADRAPVVRPAFRAGDAMLFDDLFLHRTALDGSMIKRRYAIEAWFFAPSAYPSGQVPLVW